MVKRGYVWNETETAATMYNLRVNNATARLRLPPAVSTQRWGTAAPLGRVLVNPSIRLYVGVKSQKRTSGAQVGMPKKIKDTTRTMVSCQRFTSDLKQSILVCDGVASR